MAKANADVVLISGHDGGTGASPLTSIKHAGVPWELGLAETHQTLVLNDLRSRIVVETDGQLKTGRDVVIAALLGAEEFGFATAPLVALGCIMMRVCHLNTCPVGVATQDPELRKKFTGDPEHVVNFMRFIAQEVRELMAAARLPHHQRDGRPQRAAGDAQGASTTGRPAASTSRRSSTSRRWRRTSGRYCSRSRRTMAWSRRSTDTTLLDAVQAGAGARREGRGDAADPQRQPRRRHDPRQRGHPPLRRRRACPTTRSSCTSTARPARASAPSCRTGITLDAGRRRQRLRRQGPVGRQDHRLSRRAGSTFVAEENIIIGNVAFYGATGGEAYIRGMAGERFCVRNSGVNAVVEGVGDHGCEYMTGGRVVVLGADRAQLRGRHVGRHRLRPRREPASSPAAATRRWCSLDALEDAEEIGEVQGMIRRHARVHRQRAAAARSCATGTRCGR